MQLGDLLRLPVRARSMLAISLSGYMIGIFRGFTVCSTEQFQITLMIVFIILS